MEIFSLLTFVSICIIILFKDKFFGEYLKQKAENLATKEDIGKITREIESVKAQISREERILKAKYELKYNACLDALALIDAFFSHALRDPDGKPITKENRSTVDARQCHNKLILTCENPVLLDKFLEIFFRNDDSGKWIKPPTDLLNEFRNLVRSELGFGAPLTLDRNLAWFGKFAGDTDNSPTTPSTSRN